tara:strand:- start:528 stop:947 length:420 start_codon:yes stop_codon:yes gene_type:complete
MERALSLACVILFVLFGFEVHQSTSYAEEVESVDEAKSVLPEGFVTVVVEIRAKKDTGNSLVSIFKKVLPLTRESDGIISIELVQNQDDPDALIFIERWETRDHYEKYLAERTEAGALETLAELIEGELNIRYFDQTGA